MGKQKKKAEVGGGDHACLQIGLEWAEQCLGSLGFHDNPKSIRIIKDLI